MFTTTMQGRVQLSQNRTVLHDGLMGLCELDSPLQGVGEATELFADPMPSLGRQWHLRTSV